MYCFLRFLVAFIRQPVTLVVRPTMRGGVMEVIAGRRG